jgi:hypothetical protein
MVTRLILKALLTVSVFSLALVALGSRFGATEILVWTVLLVLALWLVCRGEVRSLIQHRRQRGAARP